MMENKLASLEAKYFYSDNMLKTSPGAGLFVLPSMSEVFTNHLMFTIASGTLAETSQKSSRTEWLKVKGL